jgi:hypothetical protein
LYTTWRHSKAPHRLRAIIPLADEVTPEAWAASWRAVNIILGDYAEKHTDLSRIFFGAYAPLGTEDSAFSHVFNGKAIDPTALPATVVESAELSEIVTPERFAKFAQALKRKHDDRQSQFGDQLLRVADGVPFAEQPERDITIFKLCTVLAKRWPSADPADVAEHFRRSLSLMGADCPTVKDVAYKLGRAQRKLHEQRHEQEQQQEREHRQRILDAFGTGRSFPYTRLEIEAVKSHRWVIQKMNSYYAYVAGTYKGPYNPTEAQNALLRDLAPAISADIQLWEIDKQGNRKPKDLGVVVRQYGFIADEVAADLTAQKAVFDEKSRTLIEAPTPLRKIASQKHVAVARWLLALAGAEKIHSLLSWIAAVTLLERPCTALFLTGHKNTGKGLLVEGLAKLWTEVGQPTPLEDVLGTSFNGSQIRCPLVWADERLPTDHRGRVLNAELRQYIQARRRPLRRKFLPNADMLGAVRVVISANNERVLSTTEDLSNHDIGAIVDRYLHIPTRVEAYHYLRDTPHNTWVEHDIIAQHALWLRDNYVWEPNGRFLVHSADNALHSRLISSAGVRSAVLQFCVGYLLHPEPLDNHARAQQLIRIHDDRLLVITQALTLAWGTYVTNEPCPATGRISGAISALSDDARPRLKAPDGRRVNYRRIVTEHLWSWAETNGYASREQLLTILENNRKKDLTVN